MLVEDISIACQCIDIDHINHWYWTHFHPWLNWIYDISIACILYETTSYHIMHFGVTRILEIILLFFVGWQRKCVRSSIISRNVECSSSSERCCARGCRVWGRLRRGSYRSEFSQVNCWKRMGSVLSKLGMHAEASVYTKRIVESAIPIFVFS